MNRKEQYSLLLEDDKWKSKRFKILKRDGFKCRHCQSTNNLQVHHLIYKSGGVPPWQYKNSDLITVCIDCHTKIHNTTKIKTVGIKQNKPKSKSEKINSRIDSLKRTLSQNDLRIQDRYDKSR
jgi:5-methylcytosine-specific restriction endonuclease McrA